MRYFEFATPKNGLLNRPGKRKRPKPQTDNHHDDRLDGLWDLMTPKKRTNEGESPPESDELPAFIPEPETSQGAISPQLPRVRPRKSDPPNNRG